MNNETYYIDEELGEFDNFFKSKKRKSCEQSYIDEGRTKKQAKIQCKTDMGGSALGRTVKKGALAIPRGAFLTLMRLNFRGFASRLARAESSQPTEFARAKRKWLSLGGNESSLISAMNSAKNKKPLGCGAKCKAKIDGNFSGFSDDELEFWDENPDFAYAYAEPIVTGALITTGGAVLTAMASALKGVKQTKLEAEANQEGLDAQNEFLQKQEQEKSKRTKTLVIGAGVLVSLMIVGAVLLKKRRKK